MGEFAPTTGDAYNVIVVDDIVYWAESVPGTTAVFAKPVVGTGDPVQIFSTSDWFGLFTVADGCLFYRRPSDNALMRGCAQTPSAVYTPPDGLSFSTVGSSDESFLYFGSTDVGLMRISLSGASNANLVTPAREVASIFVEGDDLYYIDGHNGPYNCTANWGIYRTSTTPGSAPSELVSPPLECPRYLAVDAKAVYWTNGDAGTVMKVAK